MYGGGGVGYEEGGGLARHRDFEKGESESVAQIVLQSGVYAYHWLGPFLVKLLHYFSKLVF